MILLLYFILGILFYQVCCPVIDSIIGLFCTWLELIKTGLINKHNKEAIEDIPQETDAIGFHLNDNDEEVGENYDNE